MTSTPAYSYLSESVTAAMKYADEHGYEVPLSLRIRAHRATAIKAGDMGSINSKYNDAIVSALVAYFEGGSLAASRNRFKQAMVQALGDAFDLGYSDGGGELPFTGDALEWFNSRVEQEASFIDGLFADAKQLKKETDFDYFAWATDRAGGYVSSLQGVYNAGVMWASRNKAGTWRLGNTEKHCDKCKQLDGKRHKLSWFLDRNYIPRQPGAAMDCGGYHCDCRIEDDNGKVIL